MNNLTKPSPASRIIRLQIMNKEHQCVMQNSVWNNASVMYINVYVTHCFISICNMSDLLCTTDQWTAVVCWQSPQLMSMPGTDSNNNRMSTLPAREALSGGQSEHGTVWANKFMKHIHLQHSHFRFSSPSHTCVILVLDQRSFMCLLPLEFTWAPNKILSLKDVCKR